MTTNELDRLRYQPFSSIINPGFWQQLANIKLNKLKLSEDPIDTHGTYSCSLSSNLPCLAAFDHSAFSETVNFCNNSTCPLTGKLVCTNIMQQFINFDKKNFLNELGYEIWNSIHDGRALNDPEKHLSKFGLLVYADLKKYNFYYWFSFPAINYPVYVNARNNPISKNGGDSIRTSQSILEYFNEESLAQLQENYNKPNDQRNFQRGYFIVLHASASNHVSCYHLNEYDLAIKHKQSDQDNKSTLYFAYTEPSADVVHPGWPLRNFLTLIAVQFRQNQVKVLRIRKGLVDRSKSNFELHHSMVLDLNFELDSQYSCSDTNQKISDCPLVTGWEKNELQHMAPKQVNLSSLLDPRKLADDAVNLNLRLMKWRLLPALDLDRIIGIKCLLLGCGTLGCHIARGLLAWGIKHISLLDNSKISFSNPVRQTLYTFDDCHSNSSQGIYKAEAAAAMLRKIHPTVNTFAHILTIPMPGHHVAKKEIEQTKQDIEKLEQLIDNHDAIFLLMDTRESRWLPTVIAMSKQKLVINAAIGFDTFLLQRFGIRDYSQETTVDDDMGAPIDSASDNTHSSFKTLNSNKLGCYFCNDIVAPGDSTLDRTLDQQCTVSRPGVSMLVSAMAVELLASVYTSKMGPKTPAPLELQNDDSSMSIDDAPFSSELGIVPHSIRGNLARYHVYMPTSPAFNKCSACSKAVVNAYRTEKYDFLHRVFNDPSHLEEVAGLKDLQNVSDDVLALESDENSIDELI